MVRMHTINMAKLLERKSSFSCVVLLYLSSAISRWIEYTFLAQKRYQVTLEILSTMAIHKVSELAPLLLFGMILLMSNVEHADAKACTKECDVRIAYGICPRSGIKIDHNRICTNCCAGKKGCNYFSADGTFICEGESEYVSEVTYNLEKPCPLNCDPRIAYGICPLSGNKRINLDSICTNCCAGKKGCNYFSADGTFICKGESEYVSEVTYNLEKNCPKNCDTRIAYGICPLSGNKRINLGSICTNCCAGKKGCYYFSADGTFICEGESEYVGEGENDLQQSNVSLS